MSKGNDPTTEKESILRRQESLRSVIEAISSELDLRRLLTRIVYHACELLEADNGTIGLVDEASGLVRTEAAYRMPADELGAEMPPGVGLAGEVYRTKQPLVLNRYGEVENPLQLPLVENAVIGVPILWRDRMIGVFGLGSPPPRTFSTQDVEVLSLFAKHAAIAIENARLFAGAQQSLLELQLLYETSRRISTALAVEDVVAAYLEQVAARGRYACSVATYQRNEQGERVEITVLGLWTPGEQHRLEEIRYPYTRDQLDPLLDSGQTVTISDVHTDDRVTEELRAIQRASGRPALAFIPLMVRGERMGLVILSSPHIHAWTEDELRPYQVTAAQLAAAIDSRRHLTLLHERDRQLAVLEERRRLARDLHDSVTQLLFSITLVAQSILPVWKRSPEEGEKRIERLLELSHNALVEMRALLAELRPAEGEEGMLPRPPGERRYPAQEGLVAALERFLRESIEVGNLRITLKTANYVPQALALEHTAFRILQEALYNVTKHSKARQATVTLSLIETGLMLSVWDDGQGFLLPPPEASEVVPVRPGGMGLSTMRERAETVGGSLRIRTAPGQGTTVEAFLPFSLDS